MAIDSGKGITYYRNVEALLKQVRITISPKMGLLELQDLFVLCSLLLCEVSKNERSTNQYHVDLFKKGQLKVVDSGIIFLEWLDATNSRALDPPSE